MFCTKVMRVSLNAVKMYKSTLVHGERRNVGAITASLITRGLNFFSEKFCFLCNETDFRGFRDYPELSWKSLLRIIKRNIEVWRD